MYVVVSQRVAKEYGARIRRVAPRAKLIVPSIELGQVRWSDDVSRADVCCFSEDLWQEEELRRTALPEIFRLPHLKWFHTFSAGTDAPAFQALIDRGTLLTNSSGASAPSIAQFVLAMMLHQTKRVAEWAEQQRRHEWHQLRTGELTGQTIGVVGTGAIGGEVARLAQAFNMRVLGVRRSGKPARYVDEMFTARRLVAMLKRCDFVVLACPLTKETEGLLGEAELRAMKPEATLINIARGRVVDEAALVRALREAWIAGACLDVFTVEPLPESSPLWDLPGVVVTPHNSGFSPLNMDRSMAIFLDNLDRFVHGKKLRNLVTSVGR